MEETNPRDCKKLCGMLGLAMRAGKLIRGSEMVCESVRKKKAKLVLLANDVAENTKKKVQNCCTYYQVTCQALPITQAELAHAIGSAALVATVSITDASFQNALISLNDERTPQEVQG